MAKETIAKENAVTEALRRLREEETDLLTRLKPVQEAVGALERIVDKSVKKAKSTKENSGEINAEEFSELNEVK